MSGRERERAAWRGPGSGSGSGPYLLCAVASGTLPPPPPRVSVIFTSPCFLLLGLCVRCARELLRVAGARRAQPRDESRDAAGVRPPRAACVVWYAWLVHGLVIGRPIVALYIDELYR